MAVATRDGNRKRGTPLAEHVPVRSSLQVSIAKAWTPVGGMGDGRVLMVAVAMFGTYSSEPPLASTDALARREHVTVISPQLARSVPRPRHTLGTHRSVHRELHCALLIPGATKEITS